MLAPIFDADQTLPADREADAPLDQLGRPPVRIVTDWLASNCPDEHRFVVWLAGRFTPGEVGTLLPQLRRHDRAEAIERAIVLKLAAKRTIRARAAILQVRPL